MLTYILKTNWWFENELLRILFWRLIEIRRSIYVFLFLVQCWSVHYDFRIKRFSVRLYLQLYIGGLMSFLFYVICVCLRLVVSNASWIYEQHGGCPIIGKNWLLFAVHPQFFVHLFSFMCCGVFCLSSSCVLCAQCCQCLWIVHSLLLLRFSRTLIYFFFINNLRFYWK